MQAFRYDERSGESLAFQTLLQNVAQGFRQGNAVGVLQVMDDLAECMCEQQGRSGEIEHVVASKAKTTQALDCRRRFTAFRAKGRFDRNEAGPAFRTCPSPPALRNRSMTDGTRD